METVGKIHKNGRGTGMDQGSRDPPGDGSALPHNSVNMNILVVATVIQWFKMLARKETE